MLGGSLLQNQSIVNGKSLLMKSFPPATPLRRQPIERALSHSKMLDKVQGEKKEAREKQKMKGKN